MSDKVMNRGENSMKKHYDLKNPRRNPYAERMKNGYTIIIDREPDSDIEGDTTEKKQVVGQFKAFTEHNQPLKAKE